MHAIWVQVINNKELADISSANNARQQSFLVYITVPTFTMRSCTVMSFACQFELCQISSYNYSIIFVYKYILYSLFFQLKFVFSSHWQAHACGESKTVALLQCKPRNTQTVALCLIITTINIERDTTDKIKVSTTL